MKKTEITAIKEALICLLNIHLPIQRDGFKKNKEMQQEQIKYIAKTIKMLEKI